MGTFLKGLTAIKTGPALVCAETLKENAKNKFHFFAKIKMKSIGEVIN